MKKKILSICLVIALAATAVVGGTLAYFTDTDAQTNVFTTGNVKIDLWEDFDDNDGNAELIPGKKIEKEIYVTNTGSEDAYVRVHYAIPVPMADQNINSFNDILHVNFSKASVKPTPENEKDYWNWLPTGKTSTNANYKGWDKNGKDYNNVYFENIGGVDHVVFVVTYMDVLSTNEKTVNPAISNVYMDQFAKCEQNEDGSFTITKPNYTDAQNGTVDKTNPTLSYVMAAAGNGLVKVVAEAGQAEGFADAYTALNTQFGIPGSYKVDWTAAAEGQTWVDTEATVNP